MSFVFSKPYETNSLYISKVLSQDDLKSAGLPLEISSKIVLQGDVYSIKNI